jgi:mycothiol synthase
MTSIERHTALPAELQTEVRTLAADLERASGSPPLNDQSLLRLGAAGDHLVHLTVRLGPELTGYAQLDGTSAELAARTGSAAQLLAAAEAAAGRLTIWTHGRNSTVTPAVERRGYRRIRTLHQLRRSLTGGPQSAAPPADLPAGITIRSFIPGQDEPAWLAVNAAAFAGHPEQGAWTLAEVNAREAEPWFEAAGLLLAHRGPELVGFHWTKVHPDGIGEVYVIAVAPSAQGIGLGPALLGRGLAYLAGRGCREALLYVDDSNARALHLYERSGFHRHDVDIQWQLPG